MIHNRPLLVAALVTATVLACSSDRMLTRAAPGVPPTGLFNVVGTVRRIPVEGGCWVLQTATDRYEPINLPAAFRVDGRLIRAVAHSVSGASVCMVGVLIAVDTIQSR